MAVLMHMTWLYSQLICAGFIWFIIRLMLLSVVYTLWYE